MPFSNVSSSSSLSLPSSSPSLRFSSSGNQRHHHDGSGRSRGGSGGGGGGGGHNNNPNPSHSDTNANSNTDNDDNSTRSMNRSYYYWMAVAREYTSLCQQCMLPPITATTTGGGGDDAYDQCLAMGSLGPWVYLPYQQAQQQMKMMMRRADDDDNKDQQQQQQQDQSRQLLLLEARDAALEALRGIDNDNGNDNVNDYSSSLYAIATSSSMSMSLSMYTNSKIGCHALLAVIYHQLDQKKKCDNDHKKKNSNNNSPSSSSSLHHVEQVLKTIQACLRRQQRQQQQQQQQQRIQHHRQQQRRMQLHPPYSHNHSTPPTTTTSWPSSISTSFPSFPSTKMMSSDCSVWTGKAGALQAIFWLRQELNDTTIGRDMVLQIAYELLLEGYYHHTISSFSFSQAQATTAGPPFLARRLSIPESSLPPTTTLPTLVWNSSNNNNNSSEILLGAAHGLVGICHTLLGLEVIEWQTLEESFKASYSSMDHDLCRARDILKATIDRIANDNAYWYPNGNLRYCVDNYGSSIDMNHQQQQQNHVMTDWATGTSGYILLLLRASRVFHRDSQDYMARARLLADQVIWTRWLNTNNSAAFHGRPSVGLYNGMAGNSYVCFMLALHLSEQPQQQGQSEAALWRNRAEELACHAVQNWRQTIGNNTMATIAMTVGGVSTAPFSLMEGLGGLVSLILDLNGTSGKNASFPFYYQPRGTAGQSPLTAGSSAKPSSHVVQPLIVSSPTANGNGKVTAKNETQSPHRNVRRGREESAAKQMNQERHFSESDLSSLLNDVSTDDDGYIPSGPDDEFASSRRNDLPDRKYLHVQESENGGTDPLLFYNGQSDHHCNTALIDDEVHNAKTVRTKHIMRRKNSDDSTDGMKEFESAKFTDEPDNRFLQIMSDSTNELQYDENSPSFIPQITLLDEEKHNMKHTYATGNEAENGIPEFEAAGNSDRPNVAFLRMQDSSDELYFDNSGASQNPPLLDDEAHTNIVGEPPRNGIVSNKALNDVPEFQTPLPSDKPDDAFLRMQDSTDGLYFDTGAELRNPVILDEETHLHGPAPISDDGDSMQEFIEPSTLDLPEEKYLRMQDSSDDLYFNDYKETMPLLDEEGHLPRPLEQLSDDEFDMQDYSMKPYQISLKSEICSEYELGNDDDDEFHAPGLLDKPDEAFMRRQDSADQDIFGPEVNRKPLIDEEEHATRVRHYSMDDNNALAVNESDEFQTARSNDEPDQQFLKGQGSVDDMSGSFDQLQRNDIYDVLDGEEHTPIGLDLLVVRRRDDEDADDFEGGKDYDAPVQQYLAKQDSANELYYDYDADQEVRDGKRSHVRILLKEATKKATNHRTSADSPMHSPSSLVRGQKQDFTSTTRNSVGCDESNMISSLSDLAERCLREAHGEGNILNGGAGTAVYLRLKLYEMFKDTNPDKAAKYLQDALQYALSANNTAAIEPSQRPYPSLLSSNVIGAQCLLLSVMIRLDNREGALELAKEAIDQLVDLYESNSTTDCSVIFGLAGALQVIWFLRAELKDGSFGRDLALSISACILREGLDHNGTFEGPLFWEWNGRSFLGSGTGVAGILHALLGLSDDEWIELEKGLARAKDIVRETIDNLASQCHPSGNLKATLDGFEEDKSTDWTHGSPGYCLLLVRACEVYGVDKYLTLAAQIAQRVIWPRRMQRKGVGLSRGVAGVAYVFLALARVDHANSNEWKRHARVMMQSAVDDLDGLLGLSRHPNSLFEGLGGLVSLMVDLQSPIDNVRFPFFEFDGSTNIGVVPRMDDAKAGHVQICGTEGESVEKMGTWAAASAATHSTAPVTSSTTAAPVSSNSNGVAFQTPARSAVVPIDNANLVSPLTDPPSRVHRNRLPPANATKHRVVQEVPIQNTNDDAAHIDTPQQRPTSQRVPHPDRSPCSTKVCPPQIKRRIFTEALDVPLARRSTESWSAKVEYDKRTENNREASDGVFTSDSVVERQLQAETSWIKAESKNIEQSPGRPANFRRMLGGFE